MQVMKPLTGKQKQVSDFINAFIREKGFSPSLKEIAKHLGKEVSTAQYFVEQLKQKGYLKKDANMARGISPIQSSQHIPLLGYIAAGKPIEPIEVPEDIALPENIHIDPRYPHYALRVQGDSMQDMGILDNDIALIRHQLKADTGDTVVAITEKGATLKVLRKKGKEVILEPRNKDYPVIKPKQLEIRGKFVGLIREE